METATRSELRDFVVKLLARVESLELELAKAKKDSSTSSKSPSSDIVKPPKKKPTGRKKSKRGGQVGHKRQLREPLPAERVDESFLYELDAAEVRDRGLAATDEFDTIQHIELLDLPVHVTEHQLPKYLDRNGKTVLPDVPELKGPIFGPRHNKRCQVPFLRGDAKPKSACKTKSSPPVRGEDSQGESVSTRDFLSNHPSVKALRPLSPVGPTSTAGAPTAPTRSAPQKKSVLRLLLS